MSAAKMRVLVVGHAYVADVYQSKLVAVSETNNVEVGLLVPSSWVARVWGRRLMLAEPARSIRTYRSPVWFNGRAGAYLYPLPAIIKTLRNFHPDIIHVEQEVFSLSTFQLALTARLCNIPLTVFCWENVDRPLSVWRRQTRRVVLETARHIIAGNLDARDLLQKWGYAGSTTVLPQFGVDLGLFKETSKPEAEHPFTVGFVGRLLFQKGIDLILSAIQQLLNRGHACRAVICGAGPDRQRLSQEAERLGVSPLIEWQDFVPHQQVPEVMRGFDVLVLPSRAVPHWKEQFGHVLIEAMAMGIPVVGSASGEIPNVIGSPDLVFPEGDSSGLATILDKLIRDPMWRDRMGKHGRARVQRHYTHEHIASQLVDVWRTVLNQQVNASGNGERLAG